MRFLLVFAGLVLLSLGLKGQQGAPGSPAKAAAKAPIAPTSPADSLVLVRIIHSDHYTQITRDSTQFLTLVGQDTLKQGKTWFLADSMIIDQRLNVVEAFGNVRINDNDSVFISSRYLRYFEVTRLANLRHDVKLVQDSSTLTTDSLDYDVNTRIGTYSQGGKVVTGSTVLTSLEGIYFGQTEDVIFKRDVHLVDTAYDMTTDTLLYNTVTKKATFTVPTIIRFKDDGSIIHTRNGYYDLKKSLAYFGERPKIEDSVESIIANNIAYDKVTGFGEAQGNVIYRDSTDTFLSNHLNFNKIKKNVLATQKPVMLVVQNGDSTYIAADTFYSGQIRYLSLMRTHLAALGDTSILPPGADSNYHPRVRDTLNHDTVSLLVAVDTTQSSTDSIHRFVIGYHNVRVFSDSLQAKSDSMFYSDVDSVFQFYTKPAVWANHSQITGDTMFLYTKNQKPARLYVFNNGLIVNKVGADFYNQISGRTINGYFKDGELDYMRAKGNAHSIYFSENDSGQFQGLNTADADAIDLYFQNRSLYKVVFRNGVQAASTPMRQIQIEQTRLPNFHWWEALRPKSKEELFQ